MHSPPPGKSGRPPGRKHRKVAREEQDAILLGARRRPRGARRRPSWRGGAYILRLGVLPSVCDRGGAGMVLWAVMWSHRDASRFALYGDRPALFARKAGRPVHVATQGGTSRAPEVEGGGKQVLLALTRPLSPRLATSEPIRAHQVAVHSGTGSRFAGHMPCMGPLIILNTY